MPRKADNLDSAIIQLSMLTFPEKSNFRHTSQVQFHWSGVRLPFKFFNWWIEITS